jgi:hypothetical protein
MAGGRGTFVPPGPATREGLAVRQALLPGPSLGNVERLIATITHRPSRPHRSATARPCRHNSPDPGESNQEHDGEEHAHQAYHHRLHQRTRDQEPQPNGNGEDTAPEQGCVVTRSRVSRTGSVGSQGQVRTSGGHAPRIGTPQPHPNHRHEDRHKDRHKGASQAGAYTQVVTGTPRNDPPGPVRSFRPGTQRPRTRGRRAPHPPFAPAFWALPWAKRAPQSSKRSGVDKARAAGAAATIAATDMGRTPRSPGSLGSLVEPVDVETGPDTGAGVSASDNIAPAPHAGPHPNTGMGFVRSRPTRAGAGTGVALMGLLSAPHQPHVPRTNPVTGTVRGTQRGQAWEEPPHPD